MKKVIDTSSYNGEINFKSAKSHGVDGAILKIIRKDLGYDKQFLNSQKSCETNKLPWGVYNYSYADTISKAKSDMKLVCDILDKLTDKKYFTLGVWFDIENEVQAKLSKTEIANIINAAQSVVESRGYKFGVYTGLAYYNAHMDAKKILCKNWWIARYYNGYIEMNFSIDPNEKYKPLSDCFAWQYTSSGTFSPKICSGNNGHVDISVQYQEFTTNKVTSEPNTSISYYNKYTGSSTKIDEVFKAIGVTSDYYGNVTKRKPIASANGITNYTGTSTQNLNLISLAKKGTLKKPSGTTTYSSYYKKYTGKSLKIDEVFKAIGVPEKYIGSKTKRKPVAVKNGYNNYTGTSTQNLKLIALARKGTLKKV